MHLLLGLTFSKHFSVARRGLVLIEVFRSDTVQFTLVYDPATDRMLTEMDFASRK